MLRFVGPVFRCCGRDFHSLPLTPPSPQDTGRGGSGVSRGTQSRLKCRPQARASVPYTRGPLAAVEADPGAVNVYLYRCAGASGDDEAARGAVPTLGVVH